MNHAKVKGLQPRQLVTFNVKASESQLMTAFRLMLDHKQTSPQEVCRANCGGSRSSLARIVVGMLQATA